MLWPRVRRACVRAASASDSPLRVAVRSAPLRFASVVFWRRPSAGLELGGLATFESLAGVTCVASLCLHIVRLDIIRLAA
jgi:hypothetical protein